MSKLRVASILFLLSTFFLKFSSMLRDIAIAHLFGDSYVVDAYIAAMTIPNAIILFMLTGMKDAFLPSYYKYEKLGKGFSHLTNVVKGTFWISSVIAVCGAVLSPLLIRWLYPSFTGHGAEIAVWTAVIYFLSVALVGVNAVYEGYFDSQKKFSFSTFSQTIVVLCTIGGAILLYRQMGIYSVPFGYFVGTVLSFIIKLVYLRPRRFLMWSQPADWREILSFYKVFLPIGLTIAVGQINLFIDTLFSARLGEGVVSNLNYAFRLVNIPQAIFGVTIATLVFPLLAEAKVKEDMQLFRTGIEKGLNYMFLLLAPTIAGMIVLMRELVQVVYERGAFTAAATAQTSEYAIFFTGSVLFYSIQAVIAKGFYTLEKGHYILRAGVVSIIANAIFNAILSNVIGAVGLALSTSLVGFVYSAITFTTLYKLAGGFSLSVIGKEYAKITISTLVMCAVLLFVKHGLHADHLSVVPYLVIMIILGAAIYFLAAWLFRVESFKEIVAKGRIKQVSDS
ncbi:polysaccharide biosynthesis C-terminal domain-containing protein [Anoxybacillus rupiensis]|jgi:putative peptidoglycan lipid II flippase|uniref:Polysaccharide biosynthesis C-terminal domain-containing protein n=1 Tax=Anoxybacteroides rupiense TaxID=311460 RepID=A0ABT5W657_9BACL|nr:MULTISPECIES: lipid II flippase MurJ [Anoxybacillus]MBS2772742.1 polysaccharide biosynthesis C-terminal domain-containing protein [Anoxybacillus rupiensis]MDE8564809.1 polysaccharide biosynthesis C-terminal domain-containing protein [Anoxybacillus rupiensis]OQM45967.1 murein biosynthesis protein MurJ [Anoxybacillus sp. UARK-01]QHC05483.1 murein biosynthesis protein MurJ [Anoxybacillus sp. PDR2]